MAPITAMITFPALIESDVTQEAPYAPSGTAQPNGTIGHTDESGSARVLVV
jgi:hypothetical protein